MSGKSPSRDELIKENKMLREAVDVYRVSLRDQFAMAASTALIHENIGDEKYSAKFAYAYADAMLAAKLDLDDEK